MTDPPPESPTSVEAWSGLVDALRDAGATVAGLAGTPGVTDVDVAEGFRYLLHVLGDQPDRSALRDSAHPLFLPGVTPVRKLLFDNPDTDYDTAAIAGARTYRISGTAAPCLTWRSVSTRAMPGRVDRPG